VAASILALVGMSYVMVRTLEMSKSAQTAPVFEDTARRTEAPAPARTSAAANQPAAESAERDVSAAPTIAVEAESAKKDQSLMQEAAPPEKVTQAYASPESRAEPMEVAAAQKNEQQAVRENAPRIDEGKQAADSGVVGGALGGVTAATVASATPAPPPPAAPALRTGLRHRNRAARHRRRGGARLPAPSRRFHSSEMLVTKGQACLAGMQYDGDIEKV
jgi:hypothetical protein